MIVYGIASTIHIIQIVYFFWYIRMLIHNGANSASGLCFRFIIFAAFCKC